MDTVIGWSPLITSVDFTYVLVKVEKNGSETPVSSSAKLDTMHRAMTTYRRLHSNEHCRLIKQMRRVILDSEMPK